MPHTDITRGFVLHVCINGRCTVTAASGEKLLLNQHELIVVPAQPHEIVAADDVTIVTGTCDFDAAAEHPLIQRLDRIAVVATHAISTFGWMRDTVELLDLETRNRSPGALAIADRAFEVLFVQALRAQSAPQVGEAPASGFMVALADPVLRRVLEAMHAQPAERWTIEKLADSVELSRSGLTERFTNVIGVPPMQYLIDWRMQLARSLLTGTQRSIADIAKRAGYDSAAGFRRRFKARQGAAPTQFRKRGAIARAR
jgi:AraC-like DNA-binding protein